MSLLLFNLNFLEYCLQALHQTLSWLWSIKLPKARWNFFFGGVLTQNFCKGGACISFTSFWHSFYYYYIIIIIVITMHQFPTRNWLFNLKCSVQILQYGFITVNLSIYVDKCEACIALTKHCRWLLIPKVAIWYNPTDFYGWGFLTLVTTGELNSSLALSLENH